jgi:hypothetical protein
MPKGYGINRELTHDWLTVQISKTRLAGVKQDKRSAEQYYLAQFRRRRTSHPQSTPPTHPQ